jgi:hypothetical protein
VTRGKRKKNKKANYYFTQKHEDAIVAYVNTKDKIERERLYVDLIRPALNDLVDKVVFSYKFITLPNIDELKDECKVWLITVLDRYDHSKGSKAYSYFTVITKHWFFHRAKQNNKRKINEVQYDDVIKTEEENPQLIVSHQYMITRERNDFLNALSEEVDRWSVLDMKETERKVYDAVKVLLENADNIEIFNKKAIYMYLRELTGLKTKQLASSLAQMREEYYEFRKEYDRGNI